MVDMSAGTKVPQKFALIAPNDFTRLRVESQLIPFIVSTTLRAERSPDGSPPLSPAEAESLVGILDKVVSSATVNPCLKNGCFEVLRKVSPAHGVLPKSYFLPDVTLSGSIPHSVVGGFADVWKGKQGGNPVCIKAFRTQAVGNLEKIKRRFYREIVAWKQVSHPNVVPFLGVSETLFPFSIVSPWLSNGNIAEYIQKHEGVNRIQLLAQATRGLEYLHSLSIVHSNVTPGNILITEKGDARLGDFGVTGIITDPTTVDRDSMTTAKPGVTRYMAPELLFPQQFGYTDSNPSKESDVYAFAMTAYQVLSGDLPYGVGQLESVTAYEIVSGNRPPRPNNLTAARWLSDSIWNVIRHCWNQHPHLRLPTDVLRQAFVGSEVEQEGGTLVTRGEDLTTKDTGGTAGSPAKPPTAGETRLPTRTPVEPQQPPDSSPLVKRNYFKRVLARVRHVVKRAFRR